MVRLYTSFRLPVAFLLAAAVLPAVPARPVADAAPEVYRPVPMDQQRLAGIFSGRLRANTEGYLEHISPAAVLASFRHRASDTTTEAEGESAGLFLIAAANSYEYNGDDLQLKAVMDEVAKGLMTSQEPDGYLGLYTPRARWNSGDILSQACSLAGLFSYGRVTGSDEAFDAGRRAADLMMASFTKSPQAASNADVLALLAPLGELFRGTGDNKYLVFSKHLVELHSQSNATPSSTMLFAYGAAELYRLTGAEPDLKKAQSGWLQVERTLSVAGSPQLAFSAQHSASAADTCALYFWLQLNEDLLRATGDPLYADAVENLAYNQLLASQNSQTGGVNPSTALGTAVRFSRSVDSCSLAEAAALSEIPNLIWGRFGTGLGVLTFAPGRASLRLRRHASVQLYTEGSFPESGNIVLHVEPTHDTRFPLQLFVPSWAQHFTAEVGATRLAGKAGHFLTLTREWKKGDTVKIEIGLEANAVKDRNNPGQLAIRRGPQLLAVSKALNPQITADKEMKISAVEPLRLKDADVSSVMPVSATAPQTYTLIGNAGGEAQDLILVPYADAQSSEVWFAAATQ